MEKATKAKKFFLESDYPDLWTDKIRKKRWTEGYKNHFLNLLAVKAGGRVLEVGTGEGRLIYNVLENGATYVGIDISSRILKKAKHHPALFNKDLNLYLIVADAESLPFRNGVFDRIFCFATIFFLPHKWKALEEMSQCTNHMVLIEFRNLLSPAIFCIYLRYLMITFTQGAFTFALKSTMLRTIMYKIFGKEKVERFLVNPPLIGPYYPIIPLTLLWNVPKMKIDYVEGFDLPDEKQNGIKSDQKKLGVMAYRKWIKPVLLVRLEKIDDE